MSAVSCPQKDPQPGGPASGACGRGPMHPCSKAVWIHVASLKLDSLELSEFQGWTPTLHFRGLSSAQLKICQAKTICRKTGYSTNTD